MKFIMSNPFLFAATILYYFASGFYVYQGKLLWAIVWVMYATLNLVLMRIAI